MHISEIINKKFDVKSFQVLEQKNTAQIKSKERMKLEWNYKNVKTLFLKNLKTIIKKEFLQNDDNLQKVDIIVNYLIRDDKFFQSPLLRLKEQSAPNFNKGLLLVGGVGTGKSSFLEAMSKTLDVHPFLRTTYHLSSDLVMEYEGLLEPLNKREFYNKYFNGRRIFDDLLREKAASNFGKTNLIKELLASRYQNNKLTFAAINYDNQFPGDVEMALDKIGDKYEDFIYDRVFDIFNIVEFPGMSMRGKNVK
ncbi:hypothetical protein ACFFU1_08270 [Algibacter miyuki]|uniref:ATPase n=1 Tax=Algibacter miyuki TaxID=1306933 RepID=A0ABV5H068_9FLAO|nr:hypothetical protein [Algibacter miyuki]MDN3666912.1 hypothetical protein [Algibacter miyuki]